MPAGLKAQLISLGLWAMRYSTLAMLKPLALEPLIDVNRNVANGLREQQSRAPRPEPAGAIKSLSAPISA